MGRIAKILTHFLFPFPAPGVNAVAHVVNKKTVSPNRCSPARDREDDAAFPIDLQAFFRIARPSFNRFREVVPLRGASMTKDAKLHFHTANPLKSGLICLLAYSLLMERKGGERWAMTRFQYLKKHFK